VRVEIAVTVASERVIVVVVFLLGRDVRLVELAGHELRASAVFARRGGVLGDDDFPVIC
jgi:hypothetical protein